MYQPRPHGLHVTGGELTADDSAAIELLARRLTLCANHLLDESSVPEDLPEQIDLFTDYSAKEKQKKEADTAHARERKLQETMLDIKKRFGKNAILKGLNLEDGATARERNNQIGGHKA